MVNIINSVFLAYVKVEFCNGLMDCLPPNNVSSPPSPLIFTFKEAHDVVYADPANQRHMLSCVRGMGHWAASEYHRLRMAGVRTQSPFIIERIDNEKGVVLFSLGMWTNMLADQPLIVEARP